MGRYGGGSPVAACWDNSFASSGASPAVHCRDRPVATGSSGRRTPPGVGHLILGEESSQHRSGAFIDQVHVSEIPTGVTDLQTAQMPIAVRNLEAARIDHHRTIAQALHALLGAGKSQP